ncbi:uncharacterized protein LOC130994454 [Salvia miltiorrhiza]|uniref:uncharacterized protein LOC130994454 n=1 Tax=Salvia miltiorrhiza TaxID=226208 RepID=UPI0025AD9A32|nr:uncharacterized protein LOC130994454 [Salvia miltiorrhiza]
MATAEEVRALREQLQALMDAQKTVAEQRQPPIDEAFTPLYQYQEPPRVNANNFELRAGLITMVQQKQYGGSAAEDPNVHLRQFLELCSTIKMNGVADDIIRLRLFPFSLQDKAKSWYHTLQLGANPAWEEVAHLFLRKFHPPGLTLKLKMDIVQFQQFEGESLAETWERYQEKLRKCPSHGFDEGTLVVMFYNACGERTRMFMDTAAGGSLLKKGSAEAMEIIESMAATSYQWPSERVQLKKVDAASSSDPLALISTQLAELNSKISAMSMGNPEPAVEDPTGVEDANFIHGRNFGNFQRGQQSGYNRGQQYQQGGRSHSNLSYGNPNNAIQPPPGFSVTNGVINEEKKPNLEELLMKFMSKSDERMEKLESNAVAVGTQMKMFETQLGQLANAFTNLHQQGQFPSNTTVNPKEHCKAINLRSGTTYEGPKMPEDEIVSPVDEKEAEEVTVEDIISRKKRLGEFETVNLNEECSAILQKKLPAKLKDPGSFTISCIIGGQQFGKALCDLGASINLMPLSIFQRLAIGEMKPTSIALQMADRSVTYPRGIVEDVLVKVNEFIFPADFVVLDFEEDKTIPLILGRPFLATGRALIDVANGELTLRVNDENHTFSIYRALKFYDEKEDIDMEECKLLSLVDCYDTPSSWKGLGDPLEACISHFFFSADFDFPLDMHLFSDQLFECCSALESVAEIAHRKG